MSGFDVFALGRAKGLQAQIQDITIYTASGALALTNAYQDIVSVTTGSFTPNVNETAIIEWSTGFNCGGGTGACNAGDVMTSQILVNAAAQTPAAGVIAPGAVGSFSAVQYVSVALTAGTAYVIKCQAKNANGSRGAAGGSSQMKVWRVAA